jgi:hypothetical protein
MNSSACLMTIVSQKLAGPRRTYPDVEHTYLCIAPLISSHGVVILRWRQELVKLFLKNSQSVILGSVYDQYICVANEKD